MPPSTSVLAGLDTPNILVDFHAEATAEKLSMGFYLDGRVSAVVGTHTHVQTADERILPGGTAYLTDAGMCGSFDSVLGVKKELAMEKMRTQLPIRFENARGSGVLWGCVIDIDEKTGPGPEHRAGRRPGGVKGESHEQTTSGRGIGALPAAVRLRRFPGCVRGYLRQ